MTDRVGVERRIEGNGTLPAERKLGKQVEEGPSLRPGSVGSK
jgi:hypothetical protein